MTRAHARAYMSLSRAYPMERNRLPCNPQDGRCLAGGGRHVQLAG